MNLLGLIAGILGHQSHHLFDEWEGDGVEAWHRMGRYAVGMVCVAVPFRHTLPPEDRDKVMGIFWRVVVAVGMGVAGGYVLDRWLREIGK